MALLEQIFVAIISMTCLCLRYYFKNLSKKSSYSERKKFEFISVVMTAATVFGVIVTALLIVKQMMVTAEVGAAFFKMFFVGIIMCEIINYKNDELKDGLAQFLSVFVTLIITAFFFGARCWRI